MGFAYQQIENSGPVSREIAIQCLKWLLCAKRPLRPHELIEALLLGVSDRTTVCTTSELLDVCRNLIIYDGGLDILRFAHLSVKQYLETRPEFDLHRLNALATTSCLFILRELPPPNFENSGFFEYAILYWATHYVDFGKGDNHPYTVDDSVKLFLTGTPVQPVANVTLRLWMSHASRLLRTLEGSSRLRKSLNAAVNTSDTSLHLRCSFGLPKALTSLFADTELNLALDTRNDAGDTGLHVAAASEHFAIVRFLLCNGATLESGARCGRTALHHAAKVGNGPTVRLLTPFGANVNLQDGHGKIALHHAAINRNLAVIVLLIERGSDMEAESILGKKALHWAAENGHYSVVKKLLERGAEIDGTCNFGKYGIALSSRSWSRALRPCPVGPRSSTRSSQPTRRLAA